MGTGGSVGVHEPHQLQVARLAKDYRWCAWMARTEEDIQKRQRKLAWH